MRTTQLPKIVLVLSLVILASCNQAPFSKYDFSKGDYELYLLGRNDTSYFELNEFIEEYGNFKLDENPVIQELLKKGIQGRADLLQPTPPFYHLRLEKNEKFLDGALLDLNNSILIYSNYRYKFDTSILYSLSDKFQTINSFEVNYITGANTKSFLQFLNQTNGFTTSKLIGTENRLEDFMGKVELVTDVSTLDPSKKMTWAELQELVSGHFIHLGKVYLTNQSYRGGDSTYVTMLWSSDFTSDLPQQYRITKPYTDTVNWPIIVFDLEMKEILDFFEREGIQGYRIYDSKVPRE